MSDPITFVQRGLGVRLRFEFGRDALAYAIADSSGEVGFSIGYEHIVASTKSTVTVGNKNFLKKALLAPAAVLGLAFAAGQFNSAVSNALAAVGAVLLAGLLGARYLNLLSVKYTLIDMQPRPAAARNLMLRIIQDKQHDALLAELMVRWKARHRELYLPVNLANDPAKETSKYAWLKARDLITEEEEARAVAAIRANAAQSAPPAPGEDAALVGEKPRQGVLN
jgi:hypothetical protein